jgi:hypothetical protein
VSALKLLSYNVYSFLLIFLLFLSCGDNEFSIRVLHSENESSYMLSMDPKLSVDRFSFGETRLCILCFYSRTHYDSSLYHELLNLIGSFEVLLWSQSVVVVVVGNVNMGGTK